MFVTFQRVDFFWAFQVAVCVIVCSVLWCVSAAVLLRAVRIVPAIFNVASNNWIPMFHMVYLQNGVRIT